MYTKIINNGAKGKDFGIIFKYLLENKLWVIMLFVINDLVCFKISFFKKYKKYDNWYDYIIFKILIIENIINLQRYIYELI